VTSELPAGESPSRIEAFLDRLESLAGRKFSHRGDLALLLACARGKEKQLEEAAFYAKFITKAFMVMKRGGGEDLSRLEAELGQKLEKTSTLLRTLVEGFPGDAGREFTLRYLNPSPENMQRLLSLLAELSWLKNYEMENKRL
jgi:hypothetical protein